MVNKINTSGAVKCISSPRSQIFELKETLKKEFPKAHGVYVLWHSGKEKQLPQVYVGLSGRKGPRQGADLCDRLSQHDSDDKYLPGWTHCFVVIGKNRNLTPDRIKYIEARLLSLGREANRCRLTNIDRNIKQSKKRTAAKEQFLDDTLKCLEKFSVDWFSKQPSRKCKGLDFEQVSRSENRPSSPKALCLKSKGITAHGYEHRTGFIVLKDSQAVKQVVDSIQPGTYNLRKKLIQRRKFKDSGSVYVLGEDHTFTSRSAASKALLGNANDGSGWKRCQR